ncbi:terpene synthase family protein [Kitasatospora aureofaciens]|nr:terpene synthase family protein [Kitasatospora aureofaciens]
MLHASAARRALQAARPQDPHGVVLPGGPAAAREVGRADFPRSRAPGQTAARFPAPRRSLSVAQTNARSLHGKPPPCPFLPGARRRPQPPPRPCSCPSRRPPRALQFTTVLMEHAVGELHPDVLRSREFRTAVDAFVDAVSLHNDIVSYDREVEEGTIGNNGVEVARRALGVSRREATALIDGLLTARVDTLAHAPAAVPPGAAGFTRSLQEALAGSYLWHEVTGRFGPCGAAAVGKPRGLGTSAGYAFC